jgi:hypothetical protein
VPHYARDRGERDQTDPADLLGDVHAVVLGGCSIMYGRRLGRVRRRGHALRRPGSAIACNRPYHHLHLDS